MRERRKAVYGHRSSLPLLSAIVRYVVCERQAIQMVSGCRPLLCFNCTRCFCGDVSCVIGFNVEVMVVVVNTTRDSTCDMCCY